MVLKILPVAPHIEAEAEVGQDQVEADPGHHIKIGIDAFIGIIVWDRFVF